MDWLDQLPDSLRVDDATMAEAYENTGDLGRAWIKTTIALTRAVCGEAPDEHFSRVRPAGSGFIVERQQRPADWVLAVISPDYTSGVRLAAAIMAARLAGVERVVALLLQSSAAASKPASAVLTALELLGVEDIFALDADRLDVLANAFIQEQAQGLEQRQGQVLAQEEGRVLAFGTDASPFSTLPVWQAPKNVQKDTQERVPEEPASENGPLRLHPELAGAWVHVNLHREFFTVFSVSISPCTSDCPL